jgi:transposase
MLSLKEDRKVFVSQDPTDMRKSIDGLCALVMDVLHESPQCGHVFVFCNRNRNKMKCLLWDTNGFFLCYKRLEKGHFKFKRNAQGVLEISHDQFSWLLAGLDFMVMNQFSHLNYANYY